jgi:hypothetical protein
MTTGMRIPQIPATRVIPDCFLSIACHIDRGVGFEGIYNFSQ